MQTLITQDVDAVVIYNMEIVGIADLILQARQNGIGVYNVDNQLVPGVVANSCQPMVWLQLSLHTTWVRNIFGMPIMPSLPPLLFRST